MSTKRWVRVTDIAPYVESEDFTENSTAILYRLYAPEGESYPLIFVAIYGDTKNYLDKAPLTGFKMSSSSKQKAGDWWDDWADSSIIPLELLPDVQEMLEEIKSKI
jgi:hypothetical protein